MTRNRAVLYFCIFSFSLFVPHSLHARGTGPFEPQPYVHDPELEKILQILDAIDHNYYKEIDRTKCLEGMLEGGIAKCLDDPYSRYHPYEEAEGVREETRGYFGGVGMRVEGRKNKAGKFEAVVISTLKDTPAERAGIQSGDIIIAVSTSALLDTSMIRVTDNPLHEVVGFIKGKIGTKVKIAMLRGDEVLYFELVRAVIKPESIHYKMIRSRVGYVRIHEFSGMTEGDFYVAMSSITAQGARATILDVRNNPGGLLGSVINIISSFQKEVTPQVYVKERHTDYLPVEGRGRNARKYRDLKVVILANNGSASAAEILAAWLKEDFGAPVIGNTTFGKGSVQQVIELPDKSMLLLTIAEYFVGKKKIKVHEVGVTPTIEVENPKKASSTEEDAQLQRAIEEAEKLLQ